MSIAQAPNRARFNLQEILAATNGEVLHRSTSGQSPDQTLLALHTTGVSTDTRSLTANALFVALRGERHDAHQFLDAAAAAGARVALVEAKSLPDDLSALPPDFTLIAVDDTLRALGKLAAAHRNRFRIPVIGVTGSYGKTTTRALIAAALSAQFHVLSSTGNFNNEIGLPMTLLQLDHSHTAAVLELGMRGAGQIEYLAKIARPTVGVVTNIGPQHIELLHSIDNIAAAKAELLQALPPEGVAVVPADDRFVTFLKQQAPGRSLTFGTAKDADFRVSDVAIDLSGNVSCTVTQATALTRQSLRLPLPGVHNAVNGAAALAVASALGVLLPDAAAMIETAQVPGGRMRVVRLPKLTIVDDCYNAGPNSMRAALDMLRDFPGSGRRVAILGSMRELGDFSETEHRQIGAYAAARVELLIGVGEETQALLEAAKMVGAVPFHTEWCADAAAAASRAVELVRDGDVVLIKGSRSVGLETVVSALGAE